MDAKWTPGPWIVTDHSDKRLGLHVRAPEIATPSAPCPSIARIHTPRAWDEARANAKLIAAAPDLAFSLVEMVDMFTRRIDGKPGPDDAAARWDRARDALAKAGVTP